LPAKKNSKYRQHRALPLNNVAFQVLADRRAQRLASPLVFPEYHRKEYLSKPANWLSALCLAANIEDFTWHSLRHNFASQLILRSADLKTVEILMGHANIKQTAAYAELSPEHLRSAVDTLASKKPTATKTTISRVG
jgi:site-specific recombinase XerD